MEKINEVQNFPVTANGKICKSQQDYKEIEGTNKILGKRTYDIYRQHNANKFECLDKIDKFQKETDKRLKTDSVIKKTDGHITHRH